MPTDCSDTSSPSSDGATSKAAHSDELSPNKSKQSTPKDESSSVLNVSANVDCQIEPQAGSSSNSSADKTNQATAKHQPHPSCETPTAEASVSGKPSRLSSDDIPRDHASPTLLPQQHIESGASVCAVSDPLTAHVSTSADSNGGDSRACSQSVSKIAGKLSHDSHASTASAVEKDSLQPTVAVAGTEQSASSPHEPRVDKPATRTSETLLPKGCENKRETDLLSEATPIEGSLCASDSNPNERSGGSDVRASELPADEHSVATHNPGFTPNSSSNPGPVKLPQAPRNSMIPMGILPPDMLSLFSSTIPHNQHEFAAAKQPPPSSVPRLSISEAKTQTPIPDVDCTRYGTVCLLKVSLCLRSTVRLYFSILVTLI